MVNHFSVLPSAQTTVPSYLGHLNLSLSRLTRSPPCYWHPPSGIVTVVTTTLQILLRCRRMLWWLGWHLHCLTSQTLFASLALLVKCTSTHSHHLHRVPQSHSNWFTPTCMVLSLLPPVKDTTTGSPSLMMRHPTELPCAWSKRVKHLRPSSFSRLLLKTNSMRKSRNCRMTKEGNTCPTSSSNSLIPADS